jgi:hypothetical protein
VPVKLPYAVHTALLTNLCPTYQNFKLMGQFAMLYILVFMKGELVSQPEVKPTELQSHPDKMFSHSCNGSVSRIGNIVADEMNRPTRSQTS